MESRLRQFRNDAPYLWWRSAVKSFVRPLCWAAFGVRGRPALSRCADRSGDEMIDRVLVPRGCCGRSVYGGRPRLRRWRREHCGSWAQGHRSDHGRAHGAVESGNHVDVLCRGWSGGGDCVVAELAEDVVGAAAEFARDGEAGAVVVDSVRDL